jgi:poly(hydroxyalkanoate) depolymerase family esterase
MVRLTTTASLLEGLGSMPITLPMPGALPGLMPAQPTQDNGRLAVLDGFGSNPGALLGRCHVPLGLADKAPLVVVLHGCTQSAAGYDHGAGWSQLADEQGFALLFPQQQAANNPNLCFNWFSPIDARRGSGEALSIRQMIATMVAAHGLDESRIFITGLSAGGAMASIMLATYPELFAGGAIIAGLPFGAARSVNDAFARMRGEGYPSDAQLASLVVEASDHTGPWPRIAVWQGSADQTVDPSNAERIIAQWQLVQGLGAAAPERDLVDHSRHRLWRDARGRVAIEAYEVIGMGHGTPLHTTGPDGCGVAGPFMLESGISSTRRIAQGWGLLAGDPAVTDAALPAAPVLDGQDAPAHGVRGLIQSALRRAGLAI